MTAHPFRDRAAIVGVGATPYSKDSGVSTLTLALRAITAALADAGLTLADIDGVACHRVGRLRAGRRSSPSRSACRTCTSSSTSSAAEARSHAVVGAAAMAVVTGQAECVVCWRAVNARSEFRMGGTGRPPPDQLEFQYQVPYGYATRRSSSRWSRASTWTAYGATAEDFGRGRDRPTLVRAAQRAGDDAHAADDGRLPRVALDRRAVAAVRLLPRDRRRGRRGGHDAPSGRATCASRR